MQKKLQEIEKKYHDIAQQMAEPHIAADHEKYTKLAREYSDLKEIVEKYHEYQTVQERIEESHSILRESEDEELRELAREELEDLERASERLERQLQKLLVPPDPNDRKNTIMEIRAGTGGDEAAIFAGDLFRMYSKYCEQHHWKVELISANYAEHGGFKEVVFSVIGKGAYGRLKFESGIHRVQRVPDTESQGRIHTSAASIAVLPEAEDVEVELNPNDLRIDVFRASGAGGQHVNTTDSAVRIVHEPTGLVVSCQDEKSQHKNKDKALKVLKARLFNLELQRQQENISNQRRIMVRSGDRSEKIRTYNYPQGRITDHRINLTLYRLEEVMNGELDMIIDELQLTDQAERMKVKEPEHTND